MTTNNTQNSLVARYQYQAYLLRLWRDTPQAAVRASLQHARTGERHMFAELASLLAFLENQLEDRQE